MNFICYILLIYFVFDYLLIYIFIRPKGIKNKLLSCVFNEIINLVHWSKLGPEDFII